MSSLKHIYVISNGSQKTFPDNSLTHFRNALPNILDFERNENVQVSLEAIGFSCTFRNLLVPENESTPSVIVTNLGYHTGKCMSKMDLDLIRAKICMDSYIFDFSTLETNEQIIFKQYFLKDRWYTVNNIVEMCDINNSDNLVQWKFEDRKLSISNNPKRDYWVFIHPTFMENFNFQFGSLVESKEWYNLYAKNPGNVPWEGANIYNINIYKDILKKNVIYNNQFYYGFHLNQNTFKLLGTECKSLHESKLPGIIKVQSSIIASQILNDRHSKDLICFCPDFKNTPKYYYKEFEQPQRIKLENTTLTNIDISLRDENDKTLQLLPGVATLLKLKFEKMPKENKTFNVRLTSDETEMYPKNNNSIFKVKLPTTLHFNREKNWKVALTSISHPNIYSTFPGDRFDRMLLFRPSVTEQNPNPDANAIVLRGSKIFKKEEEIIEDMNEVFKDPKGGENFGEFILKDGVLTIDIKTKGYMVISNNVLNLLGYRGLLSSKKGTPLVLNEGKHTKFEAPIDLTYLQPDYVIGYCDIVQPSIIGGEYTNILRIIPIPPERSDYIIQEFKNKNFLPLLNTEISEIEINFRGHDGLVTNFSGSYKIIVNLEFSNSE